MMRSLTATSAAVRRALASHFPNTRACSIDPHRTVASVLRILGLAHERRFCRDHRVLSRAVWSPRAASQRLRRDVSGRCRSAPHLRRHRALAPRGGAPISGWPTRARQLLPQVRRWRPGRAPVVFADASFATTDLLAALAPRMTCVTRLRLDARLFTPAPPRCPRTNGRPRVKRERLPLLMAVLTDSATAWQRVTVAGWYGEGARDIELATRTAVWHYRGQPLVIRTYGTAHGYACATSFPHG